MAIQFAIKETFDAVAKLGLDGTFKCTFKYGADNDDDPDRAYMDFIEQVQGLTRKKIDEQGLEYTSSISEQADFFRSFFSENLVGVSGILDGKEELPDQVDIVLKRFRFLQAAAMAYMSEHPAAPAKNASRSQRR